MAVGTASRHVSTNLPVPSNFRSSIEDGDRLKKNKNVFPGWAQFMGAVFSGLTDFPVQRIVAASLAAEPDCFCDSR